MKAAGAADDQRPVALVLGGAIAHIALVQALARRGFRTVLLDYHANPPAKAFSDAHVQASTLDQDAVLQAAREHRAAVVITLCLDQPIPIACAVSEQLGLPIPYGSGTARMVTDKAVMKQVMADNGIPTAPFVITTEEAPPDLQGLHFPVIIKPVDSTGSQGVFRAERLDEVEEHVRQARKAGLGGGVIIEECCDGVELNIHCLVVSGVPQVLLVARKGNTHGDVAGTELFTGSMAPHVLTGKEQLALQELLAAVVRHFGISDAPLLVQAFLKDGRFTVIELAARVGGGMAQQLVGLLLGYDLMEAAIDLYLGRSPSLPARTQAEGVAGTIILYARGGVFGRITGLEELIAEGLIVSGHNYRTAGMRIPEPLSSKSRVGAIVVHAPTAEALRERIANVLPRIDVLDDAGRSLFVRSLYAADADGPAHKG